MYGERVIIKLKYCTWTSLQCSAAALSAFSSWQITWLLSYHNKYSPLEKTAAQWRLEPVLAHTQVHGCLDLIFGQVSLFTVSLVAGVLPHLLSDSSPCSFSSRRSQQAVQCLSHLYSVLGWSLFPVHHFSHHLQLGAVILTIGHRDVPPIFWSSRISKQKTRKAYRLYEGLVHISWCFFF